MKNKFVLVASDVHSDDEAFEKLCEIANSEDCLAFVYAGDLDVEKYFIGQKLRNRNFVFLPVRGNCDSVVSYVDAALPTPPLYREIEINKLKLFVTHGHLYSDPKSAGLDNSIFNIVINGHSHIPMLKKEIFLYLNPGSASRPRSFEGKTYSVIEFANPVKVSILQLETGKCLYSETL